MQQDRLGELLRGNRAAARGEEGPGALPGSSQEMPSDFLTLSKAKKELGLGQVSKSVMFYLSAHMEQQ